MEMISRIFTLLFQTHKQQFSFAVNYLLTRQNSEAMDAATSATFQHLSFTPNPYPNYNPTPSSLQYKQQFPFAVNYLLSTQKVKLTILFIRLFPKHYF
jgi:hypothetical protein